jgi:hypothetical protein
MFGPRYFGSRYFAPRYFGVGGAGTGLDPTIPWAYALVSVGPLSRQDFPAAAAPLVDPKTYTAPFLRLLNGEDVAGPADFRGFVVVLPAVVRQDA